MEQFLKRIENLLTVKSIVTLALTAVFACQAIKGEVSQDFMMIYTTVIAFYFGTQAQKLQSGAGMTRMEQHRSRTAPTTVLQGRLQTTGMGRSRLKWANIHSWRKRCRNWRKH